MKFTVQVTGEAALGLPEQDFEVEAIDGNAAVAAANDKLDALVPAEGGALDIVVSSTEDWVQISRSPRGGEVRETIPAGEVSRYSRYLEPHESVRAEVEEKRAAAEAAAAKAAEREAIKAELRAEMEAEAKAGKAVSQ